MPVQKIIPVFVLLFYGILSSAELSAQAPFFKNISYEKEKKNVKLTKIFQDHNGYIWLGSNYGVSRYDGISFKYLESDSNEVSALAESNDGVLWMGHKNGSIEFLSQNEVKKYKAGAHPSVAVTKIVFDKQNRLWLGSYGEGIYCYDRGNISRITTTEGLADNNVYDLLLVNDTTIWIATDLGVSVCSINGKGKIIQLLNEASGLPDNIVRTLNKDEHGYIWIGMQDKGVCYYDISKKAFLIPPSVNGWPYRQVNKILPMKREVLIATDEEGIVELHPNLSSLNKMSPAKARSFQSVQELLQDNKEQVWVIADNKLSLANSNRFQLIEIPIEWQSPIKAITCDTSGKLWFVSEKGFFSKKNNNEPIVQETGFQQVDCKTVVSMYADTYNDLWIGTYNNGLYKYSSVNKLLQHYTTANGLIDNNIICITGRGNECWIGTLGGATKMDIAGEIPVFTNFSEKQGLRSSFIYDISIDYNNNKWFASDGGGIFRLDNSGFHSYPPVKGTDKAIVYAITQDIYGNTWFMGPNSGLIKYDGEKFTRFTVRQGLHDNDILNLVADTKGNLLLSHPDGLEIFNVQKEAFHFFGAESGFEGIRPELNAFCVATTGEIYIGCANKIIQYYPSSSRSNFLPGLILKDVQVFFQSVGTNDKAVFNYDENHISFDYAGLWYLNPEAVEYRYQLEGYSKTWIDTRDHLVTFPNLPAGKYTFRVLASVNNDFRNAPSFEYHFTVLKPFWKTWWFITLVTAFICLLIYYFIRLSVRIAGLKQERESQKLLSQLNVLKNQLNPHFLFNSFNTLLNIIDKDKKSAMEFTEQLSDFYREVMIVQPKELITLADELKLLAHYFYLQQQRFGKSLQVILNVGDEYMHSMIPPLVLQMLAENALKHNSISENHPLIIRIETAQRHLLVSNNINKHGGTVQSTGIGLENIKQRILMLTGKEVKVIHTEDEFTVIIPL